MYLRHSTIKRGGKTHTYWRLVRSVRCGRKVRQETVAQLGELDADGRLAARSLAERLVGAERHRGCSTTKCRPSPSRSICVGCGWNADAVSATCGWRGGCGRRLASITS